MVLEDLNDIKCYFNEYKLFEKPVRSIILKYDEMEELNYTEITYDDGKTYVLKLNDDGHETIVQRAEEFQEQWKENSPLSSESRPLRPLKVQTGS